MWSAYAERSATIYGTHVAVHRRQHHIIQQHCKPTCPPEWRPRCVPHWCAPSSSPAPAPGGIEWSRPSGTNRQRHEGHERQSWSLLAALQLPHKRFCYVLCACHRTCMHADQLHPDRWLASQALKAAAAAAHLHKRGEARGASPLRTRLHAAAAPKDRLLSSQWLFRFNVCMQAPARAVVQQRQLTLSCKPASPGVAACRLGVSQQHRVHASHLGGKN